MMAFIAIASAGTCVRTNLAELNQVPSPAVFVLGERKGTQPDLGRASRLVARLQSTGAPITIALQAIEPDKQPVLDRYAAGEIASTDLAGLLDWSSAWGFPYLPYTRLVTASTGGATVLGVGQSLATPDQGVQIAPGYASVLSDAMAGHYMPVELETDFTRSVSWLEHRIAKTAIEGWSGEGYLVILADRAHVEGGKGISWQASRLTEEPVHAVLLSGPGACYEGDRHL